MDLIPGSRRPPGGGHSNPLQYSCLENPMERGARWATVHRVAKSQTLTEWVNHHHQSFSVGLSVLSDSLGPLICNPMDCSLAGFCPWNSPGKTGVSYHSLLQRIFPTRNWTWVSCVAGLIFTIYATKEALWTGIISCLLYREIHRHKDPQRGLWDKSLNFGVLPLHVLD